MHVTRGVFTVEERDRIRDRILEIARQDPRVVAGAMIGSLTTRGGDRWSDLDLTFGLAQDTKTADVLTDWTRTFEREFQAVHLFDLPYQTTIYRVFLFPGHLQVDISFTPEHEFGALGPKFRLLFGRAVERAHIPGPAGAHLFGLAVHHALRARFSIERGRWWQAEYWISSLRDEALSLACLHHGLEPRYARGYDDLPAETTARFDATLVRSLDRDELMRALGCAIDALLRESRDVKDMAASVESQLRALASPWSES